MLPTISVTHNIESVMKDFKDIAGRHLPFAIAKTLTDVGKSITLEMEKKTSEVFDRPTRFIQQGFKRTMARKGETSITVSVRPKQQPAMYPQIHGGDRLLKRFETLLRNANFLPSDLYCVPGAGAKLNRYGSITGGQITQILWSLKAFPDYRSAMQAGTGKRQRKLPPYFVISPGNHLPPGIWLRNGRNIRPVIIFVRKPTYRIRFKFYEIAQQVVDKEFEQKFTAALQYALSTAR